MIKFFIPGKPSSKGRPRFNRKTGHAYTPEKTRSKEAEISVLAIKAMTDANHLGFEEAVSVEINALYPIPVSWSKKRKEEAKKLLPIVKPDLDNVCKLVLDALNGVVFEDDNQITTLIASKRYVSAENAGVWVTIKEDV